MDYISFKKYVPGFSKIITLNSYPKYISLI